MKIGRNKREILAAKKEKVTTKEKAYCKREILAVKENSLRRKKNTRSKKEKGHSKRKISAANNLVPRAILKN